MIIDIIGAGIGGLTTGIALKRKGFKVRVFEQTKEIKAVGAGIILANNAMQVYKKLGLSKKISEMGNVVSNISVTDDKLKLLFETDLLLFEKKYHVKNIAIHRAVLIQILLNEFEDDELFLAHQLKNCRKIDKRQVLFFKNGKEYFSDVLIGADGIMSKVRTIFFDNVCIRKSNQMCWRGVLDYTLPSVFLHKALEAWGKESRFGFVQIGKDKVYWYALKNIKGQEDLFLNIDDFNGYDNLVKNLLKNTPASSIHAAEIKDVKPFKGWSTSSVCLLGDAAHAATPNLGQGACQAIEDAYVLSNYLKIHDVEKAFLMFEKSRIKKAHNIVKTSFLVGKISQLSNSFLRSFRNRVLKTIPSRFNKAKMKSIFTLSGIS